MTAVDTNFDPVFTPVSPLSKEWHELRLKGIGGSDVPCLFNMGFDGRSAFTLYQEKRREIPSQKENWNMRRGRAMEPEIRNHYTEMTGREVATPTGVFNHPKYKHMLANVDGIAGAKDSRDKRLLEIKTARMRLGWGEPGTDQIPEAYLLQVQHYLCILNLPVADIAVSFGFDEPELYHVEADTEIHEMLIEKEMLFWADVQAGHAPDASTPQDAQRKFRRPSLGTVTAGLPEVEAYQQMKALKDHIALLEEQLDEQKARVMNFMGNYETLLSADGTTLATWKLRRGAERLNTRLLKAEKPDIFQLYAETGEDGRTFLLK